MNKLTEINQYRRKIEDQFKDKFPWIVRLLDFTLNLQHLFVTYFSIDNINDLDDLDGLDGLDFEGMLTTHVKLIFPLSITLNVNSLYWIECYSVFPEITIYDAANL